MADSEAISLLCKYTIPFEDGTTQTSNRFYLTTPSGPQSPANDGQWDTLAINFSDDFLGILGPWATLDQIVGYDIGDDVGVKVYDYGSAGTHNPTPSRPALPAQCCSLMKWTTDERTSRNHPIYLWNYVHAQGYYEPDPEKVAAQDALHDFGEKLTLSGSGFSDGVHTWHKCSRKADPAIDFMPNFDVHYHELFA
jgi:hypothetical protein